MPADVRKIAGILTQNNAERTNRESRIKIPPDFTWTDVENILFREQKFPSMVPLDPLKADYCSTQKYLRTSRFLKRAIAPERQQSFFDSIFREVADEQLAIASTSVPFCPRGQTFVPMLPAIPATVLNFVVPNGYQFWIEAYAFDLFPNTVNELNYGWRIFVNGQDILNKGSQGLLFGRPVKSNEQVFFGKDRDSQILAVPGNEISVIVQAAAAIPAGDQISATIFGTLEPAT